MQKVVLGLGSNINPKINYLRKSIKMINNHINTIIALSKIYQTKALLPVDAPISWDMDFYNMTVLIKTNLDPYNLLFKIKYIEKLIGRNHSNPIWSPRKIDIDILCYGNLKLNTNCIHLPHKSLLKRNFALQPLLEVYPNWNYPKKNINLYAHLKCMDRLKLAPFNLLTKTKIIGIINLSKDSFSDKERITLKNFEKCFIELIEAGAEIIDLGAESTKPNITPKTWDEYWIIIEPYLKSIEKILDKKTFSIHPKISIDTYHFKVVKKALKFPFIKIINDVYGIEERKIIDLIKDKNIKYIFMHQLGKPSIKYINNNLVCSEIILYAQKKIQFFLELGMLKKNLIFDIGIGFAKYSLHAIKLLKNIKLIKSLLNIEIMVGHSRKLSVMPMVFYDDPKSNLYKDIATTILSYELMKNNVDYIRVHNVYLNNIAKLFI